MEFDAFHRTEKKYEAADALLQISITNTYKSPLEDELSLLVNNYAVSTNISNTPDNSNDHHVIDENNTKLDTDKSKYYPLTLFELIRVQKNVI